MSNFNAAQYLKSLANAERRPLTKELVWSRESLIALLTDNGYCVSRQSGTWMRVNKAGQEPVVSLEIDPHGSNLDIILLVDEQDKIKFPLGGAWNTSSTVKLVEDNIDFAFARIESFFGVADIDDRTGTKIAQDVEYSRKMHQTLQTV